MPRHPSIPQHPSRKDTYLRDHLDKLASCTIPPDVAHAHAPCLPRLASCCPADTHTYLKEGSIPMIARRPIRTPTALPHTTMETLTRYLTYHASVVVNSTLVYCQLCPWYYNIVLLWCILRWDWDWRRTRGVRAGNDCIFDLLMFVQVSPACALRCGKVFV